MLSRPTPAAVQSVRGRRLPQRPQPGGKPEAGPQPAQDITVEPPAQIRCCRRLIQHCLVHHLQVPSVIQVVGTVPGPVQPTIKCDRTADRATKIRKAVRDDVVPLIHVPRTRGCLAYSRHCAPPASIARLPTVTEPAERHRSTMAQKLGRPPPHRGRQHRHRHRPGTGPPWPRLPPTRTGSLECGFRYAPTDPRLAPLQLSQQVRPTASFTTSSVLCGFKSHCMRPVRDRVHERTTPLVAMPAHRSVKLASTS